MWKVCWSVHCKQGVEDWLFCSSVQVEIECVMPRHSIDGDEGWKLGPPKRCCVPDPLLGVWEVRLDGTLQVRKKKRTYVSPHKFWYNDLSISGHAMDTMHKIAREDAEVASNPGLCILSGSCNMLFIALRKTTDWIARWNFWWEFY